MSPCKVRAQWLKDRIQNDGTSNPEFGSLLNDMYHQIMDQVHQIIDKAMLELQLQGMHDALENALSHVTSAVHIQDRDFRFSEFDTIDNLIEDKQLAIFHSECAEYSTNQITNSSACISWQQQGTVLTGIALATLHVNLMMELLRMSP